MPGRVPKHTLTCGVFLQPLKAIGDVFPTVLSGLAHRPTLRTRLDPKGHISGNKYPGSGRRARLTVPLPLPLPHKPRSFLHRLWTWSPSARGRPCKPLPSMPLSRWRTVHRCLVC